MAPGVGFASEWIPDGLSHPFPDSHLLHTQHGLGRSKPLRFGLLSRLAVSCAALMYPELSRHAVSVVAAPTIVVSRDVDRVQFN